MQELFGPQSTNVYDPRGMSMSILAIEKCTGNSQAIKFNSIFINTVNQTAGIYGFSGMSGVIPGTLATCKAKHATIFLLIPLHRF